MNITEDIIKKLLPRKLAEIILPNPFVQILKKLKNDASIILFWNRGLGDIPLLMYPLLSIIRKNCHNAKITIITRKDLYEGFLLLDASLTVFSSEKLIRKMPEPYSEILAELNLIPSNYDYIFYRPAAANWGRRERKGLICRLNWNETFFTPHEIKTTKPIAVLHINSETVYKFEKNLAEEAWHYIIGDLKHKGYFVIAVGFSQNSGDFDVDQDLRGKTSLFELISLMINHKGLFIGPDSGLLNTLYYLDVQVGYHLISFWSNPRVGLLKQNTPSPNNLLKNDVILAPDENLSKLSAKVITDLVNPVVTI